MKKKPNLYNSDVVQCLLDVTLALERLNINTTDIYEILTECNKSNSELRQTADSILHKHRYPDKNVFFSQNVRYDEIILFYSLPRGEQILFSLMRDIQDPQTGYVTVRKGIFSKALHFTDTERKNFQAYLDDLTEKGFLTCNYRATNKKPGEYKINQGLSWIGKRDKRELWNLEPCMKLYTIGDDTVILADGTHLSSKTLKLIDADGIITKKEGQRCTADSQHESLTDSNNHNQIHNNMRVHDIQENIFTQQEIDMFEGKI